MTKFRQFGLRLLVLALCAASIAVMASPLAADAAGEQKHQSLTTLVRYRGYVSAAVIGQMENGTEVTVLGENKDYYKVDCYDMTGYIAKTQLVHKEGDRYYVNCKPGSAETASVSYYGHSDALVLRHEIFELAKKQLGSRYVYGSARPGAFDCSGLMYYLYGQYGIQLNRTASTQMNNGIIVAKEGLQVGDLVFFRERGERSLSSHVGVYVGNNKIIHASTSRGVEYADLDFDYFAEYYQCARRIINTDSAKVQIGEGANVPAAMPVATGRRTR